MAIVTQVSTLARVVTGTVTQAIRDGRLYSAGLNLGTTVAGTAVPPPSERTTALPTVVVDDACMTPAGAIGIVPAGTGAVAWYPHPTIDGALSDADGNIRWRLTDYGDYFVPGQTKPTPANTGVPDGVQLEDVQPDAQGNIILAPGTYTHKRFNGQVMWTDTSGRPLILRECELNAGTPASDLNVTWMGLSAPKSSGGPVLLERCTFIPKTPQVNVVAMVGSNVTTHRCRATGGWTDCLNWQSDTTNLNPGSCYSIGDYLTPTIYEVDPHQQGGRSHSDCIQTANGRGHRVYGSTLAAPVGEAYAHGVVISNYASPSIGGMDVIRCWCSGGGAQVSAYEMVGKAYSPYIPNLRIIGNRFDAAGTLNNKQGGLWRPQSILLPPATFAAAEIADNIQTTPTTPPPGETPYGATATEANPAPAWVMVASNG